MSDIYDDDDLPITLGSPAPVDRGTAEGFLSKYRSRADKAEAQFDALMKQRSEAINAARGRLDQTIAEMRAKHDPSGGINLPLLALGAGLLSGNPRGGPSDFGQELGRGLSSMGQTVRAQRMSDVDFLRGLSDLQRRSDEMADMPLKDAMAIEGRKQIAAENAAAGMEKALIRANGEGATPAKIKEFREWQKAPGNEAKTYQDFLKWKADELGADKTPALMREFYEWKKAPGNEGKSLPDFYTDKARTQSGGRELGKSQAEATQALPNIDSTIEQMTAGIEKIKNHPGLPKAVGLPSVLPSIPGGEAADFETSLDQLKGQAFLFQFDKLRGAGAITESEGRKATDALAALSLKQGPKQFKENLDTVLSILNKGREVVRKKAGMTGEGASGIATPKTKEEFEKLAPGTRFIDPDGKARIKQ